MKNLKVLGVILFLVIGNLKSISQNVYPTSPNTFVQLEGGGINIIKPVAQGAWARGILNYGHSNNIISGIGLFGVGSNNGNYYYMAMGDSPWSSGNGIYVNENGNVGIGKTNPTQKLEVVGIARMNAIHLNENGSIVGIGNGKFSIGEGDEIWSFNGKRLGVGKTNPTQRLDVAGIGRMNGIHLNENGSIVGIGNGKFSIGEGDEIWSFNGKGLGIGTNDTKGFKLAVKGKIGAGEIEVKSPEYWPDFVFNKQYNLMPLTEVESFIEKNNHLPDIPSETEVKENGLNIGDMNAKLLQKIEELTLYMIEQNKKTDKIIEENKSLKKEVEALKLKVK